MAELTNDRIEKLVEETPYIFGDAQVDRYRLRTQAEMFSIYLRNNAQRLVGNNINSILDLGCGEGQLGFVLREIYPHARLVGLDRDEQAIAAARHKAQDLHLSDAEFIVGDVEQGLPPGPFDLIYASAIISHTHQPEQVVQAANKSLQPGGYLWIKDFDPAIFDDAAANALYGGKNMRVIKLLMDAIGSIGGHPYHVKELPGWLANAGFINVRYEREYAKAGGQSAAGRAGLALGLGAFYNARTLISRTQGIPEAELTQLYLDVINEAMRSKDEASAFSANYIAQKPA